MFWSKPDDVKEILSLIREGNKLANKLDFSNEFGEIVGEVSAFLEGYDGDYSGEIEKKYKRMIEKSRFERGYGL